MKIWEHSLLKRLRRRQIQVVGQEELVDVRLPVLGRVGGVGHGDEVGGDEPGALVDELVEGVLAVGAGLAPEDLIPKKSTKKDNFHIVVFK